MKKLNVFIMAIAMIVSGSVWAGKVPAKVSLKQTPAEISAEPQPFQIAQGESKAVAKKAPRKSTAALENDQVLLTVIKTTITASDTIVTVDTIGLKSIVAAFQYVNSNCTSSDTAVVTLQKSIDLALADYQETGSGVKLTANHILVLDLNGFNFTSSINSSKSGGTWGADDGKANALIVNEGGTMFIVDNTFDASSVDLTPSKTEDPTAHAIIFTEETPDACKTHSDWPYYASNTVNNAGAGVLTIKNVKIINHSHGGACYGVDVQNGSANTTLRVESGSIYSQYCNGIRQFLGSGTSTLIIDGGVVVGGSWGIWTQNPNTASVVKPIMYFNGGKVMGDFGFEQYRGTDYECGSYYTYTYGGKISGTYKFGGTEFDGRIWIGSGGRGFEKSNNEDISFIGSKLNGDFILGASYETLNIQGGIINGSVHTSYTRNDTINISGGTITGDVYLYYPGYVNKAYTDGRGVINISNGEIDGEVCAVYHPNPTINISGGLLKGEVYFYTYLGYDGIYSCNGGVMNISGGVFRKKVCDYKSDNVCINVTDGWFDVDIYTNESTNSSIDIQGGCFIYDETNGCDWPDYINKDFTKIDGEWENKGVTYYHKVDKAIKPTVTAKDNKIDISLVQDSATAEPREPEPTDNIVVVAQSTPGVIGRDTLYIDNIDVHGLTFVGADTVDVIATNGNKIGFSGIKSDTTTVYLTVEGGGVVSVGKEGIEGVDSVVLHSDENGNAVLLIAPSAKLSPEQKQATVELNVAQARKATKKGKTVNLWQHIAIPTKEAPVSVTHNRKDADFRSYVQWWNNTSGGGAWEALSGWGEMNKPFIGYIITNNSESEEGVTYTFKGEIIGNSDGICHFKTRGYNFFGNSYTAPIDVQTMVDEIEASSDDSLIELTVWIYSAEKKRYLVSNNMQRLWDEAEFTTISSMQGFWLLNISKSAIDGTINYEDAVWNPEMMPNPRVEVPSRRVTELGESMVKIMVEKDGREDCLMLVEGDNYTEAFDNGCDASKMMDNNFFNFYAKTIEGQYACLATDNLPGTILAFESKEAGEYTMTFPKVYGKEFAIYDMLTGKTTNIEEGGFYQFTADANISNEGRFMLVSAHKAPTAVDNVNAAAVQGIYTLVGQQVGTTDAWNTLPAGVYVINGQKVIK